MAVATRSTRSLLIWKRAFTVDNTERSELGDYQVSWDVAMPGDRACHRRAEASGAMEKQRLLNALREIEHELAVAPLSWGEPKFEWKNIAVLVCLGFSNRFRVTYGVHVGLRKVFVREFCDFFE
jgi:hypothetical protein